MTTTPDDECMRAIQCTRYGSALDLTVGRVPVPQPAPGEVLLAVEAVGLGYVDALLVAGGYQVKSPLPFIPGNEVAGRVVDVGVGTPAEWLGRRVMVMAPGGGLAERLAVPFAACAVVPDGISAAAAAGALTSYCTAIYGLEDCGHLQAGETVLVLGAAGTVGLAAIALAKAMGARVIAAASSAIKLHLCSHAGADATVDYSLPDWRREVQLAAGSRGVQVVYDPVGGDYSEIALRCLSPGGRLLVVGFASGSVPKIALNLPLLKRCAIVGVDLGGEVRAHANGTAPFLKRLAAHMAAGTIRPQPTSVHTLEEAPQVLQRFVERSSLGRPVVVIDQAG